MAKILTKFFQGYSALYGNYEVSPPPTPEELFRNSWDMCGKAMEKALIQFEDDYPEVVQKSKIKQGKKK